jgi:hypothetical protein
MNSRPAPAAVFQPISPLFPDDDMNVTWFVDANEGTAFIHVEYVTFV